MCRTVLWSALQATQLVHIDREIATGVKAVDDTTALPTAAPEVEKGGECKAVKEEEENVNTEENVKINDKVIKNYLQHS